MTKSVALIRGNNGSNRASSPSITNTRAPGSTTILVNTVAGVPDSFVGEMGTPNLVTGLISNGVVFRGHVDSTNLIIDEIAVGYADGGSAVNDVVVIKPTAEWANNIADVLDTSHDDDGTLNAAALGQIWPVGAVYIETTGVNPATTFGFGTWAAFAAGRTLIGVGTSDQAFAPGATGGESAHVLTVPEIPSHNHGVGAASNGAGSLQFSGHNGTDITIVNTTNTGGGGSHNNLQPYIVTYMWQRTA